MRTTTVLRSALAAMLAWSFVYSVHAQDILLRGSVVDQASKPVIHADVGITWQATDGFQGPIPWVISDDRGHFQIPIHNAGQREFAVMALDAERERGGIVLIEPRGQKGPTLVRLQKVITVEGHAYCSELGWRPESMLVQVRVLPATSQQADESSKHAASEAAARMFRAAIPLVNRYQIKDGQFSFQLPPGRYALRINAGVDFKDAYKVFALSRDQATVDLGSLEMEMTQMARLYGKPAPHWNITESRGIAKDSQITDLRGKWVLVEFWGYWCGPCITRSLPQLMKFYEDRGADRDRFEIVAIHHNGADSLEALDEKLEDIREKHWGGRKLPFPVIVDATDESVTRFGVDSFPRDILINPDGRVSRLRGIGSLAKILDGQLVPAENRPLDTANRPVKDGGNLPTTPLANDHVESDACLRCDGLTLPATNGSFTSDAQRLVTGDCSAQLVSWDVATGRRLRAVKVTNQVLYTSLGLPAEILPDGQSLISAMYPRPGDANARHMGVYSLETLEMQTPPGARDGPLFAGMKGSVHAVDVSPDGKRVVTASWVESTNCYEVTVWSLDSGENLRTWHRNNSKSLGLSPDGTLVAIGSGGNETRPTQLELLDVTTGRTVWKHLQPGWAVTDIDFSSDGRRIASTAWNETIVIRETQSGEQTQTFRTPGHKAYSVAFSPNGIDLATGGTPPFCSVRLWDTKIGRLRATLIGHNGGEVKSVFFSPDAARLASVGGSEGDTISGKGEVYVWNLSALLNR